MKLLEFIFSGFWTFLGCLIILNGILRCPVIIINRILRSWNIRKHGWPPEHCDADGDFKVEKETKD